jgi:hypothetical protein
MKNIGGTDNPSSVDDTSNINSSSVLTIGLPSVISNASRQKHRSIIEYKSEYEYEFQHSKPSTNRRSR